jgi:hypothetical protein
MPGNKGPALADRMRVLLPGIRVLLMAGRRGDTRRSQGRDAVVNAVRASLDVPLSSTPASQG